MYFRPHKQIIYMDVNCNLCKQLHKTGHLGYQNMKEIDGLDDFMKYLNDTDSS